MNDKTPIEDSQLELPILIQRNEPCPECGLEVYAVVKVGRDLYIFHDFDHICYIYSYLPRIV